MSARSVSVLEVRRARRVRAWLAVTIYIIFSVLVADARARGLPAEAPPDFPDPVHVPKGCHISTLAYVARFGAAAPHERAQPLVIALVNQGGERKPHTVALLTWRGEWWCRDEYFGVFPLHRSVRAQPRPESLAARAAARLEEHAHQRTHETPASHLRSATPEALPSTDERDLALAAAMLPYPAQRFEVRCATGVLAVLLFRPGPDEIALYTPRHGTCIGRGAIRDDARAVNIIATQLGYHVLAVGPTATAPI
jgi:hypothetical protein